MILQRFLKCRRNLVWFSVTTNHTELVSEGLKLGKSHVVKCQVLINCHKFVSRIGAFQTSCHEEYNNIFIFIFNVFIRSHSWIHNLLQMQLFCWKRLVSKSTSKYPLNPNKAGLFEGSFFWGRGGGWLIWPPVHISRSTYLTSI